MTSTPGEGSTFTFYLPTNYAPVKMLRKSASAEPLALPPALVETEMSLTPAQVTADALIDPANFVDDDSDTITSADRVLLVVENDENFARFLVDMAHENGFKAVVASRGATAVALAREIKPAAITLDINLPDMDGWRIMNRLKDEITTRHIPVQIISTDEEHDRGIRVGAIGVLTKPVKTKEMLDETFKRIREFIDKDTRELLFVHAHDADGKALMELLAAPG